MFNTKKHLPCNRQGFSSCGALNQWRTALVTRAENFSQDILTALAHGQSRSRYSGFDAETKSRDTNTRCSLIGDRRCVITPVRRPVHPRKTTEWLKERGLIPCRKSKQRDDELLKQCGTPCDSIVAIPPVTVKTDSLAETSIECLSSQTCSQMTGSLPAEHSTPVSKKRKNISFSPLKFTPIRKHAASSSQGAAAARARPIAVETRQTHAATQKRVKGMDKKFSGHGSSSNRSFLDGPTQNNSYGFEVSQHNVQDAKALHEVSVSCKLVLNTGVVESGLNSLVSTSDSVQHGGAC